MIRPLTLQDKKKKADKNGKGRCFTVQLLAYVTEEAWLPRTCPLFLAVAAPVTTLRAWLANFRAGVPARMSRRERLVQHKEWPLRCKIDRREEGAVAMLWHGSFELEADPLAVSDGLIEFVAMPRREWLAAQAARLGDVDDAEHAARAALFCAYISRRTHLPIPTVPAFQQKLFDAAYLQRWCSTPEVVGDVGYGEPVACAVAADTFESFLVEQIRDFFGTRAEASFQVAATR